MDQFREANSELRHNGPLSKVRYPVTFMDQDGEFPTPFVEGKKCVLTYFYEIEFHIRDHP